MVYRTTVDFLSRFGSLSSRGYGNRSTAKLRDYGLIKFIEVFDYKK